MSPNLVACHVQYKEAATPSPAPAPGQGERTGKKVKSQPHYLHKEVTVHKVLTEKSSNSFINKGTVPWKSFHEGRWARFHIRSPKDYIATSLLVGSFTFLSNIIISSFRNCGRITPHSFDLTLFLIQIMDAYYSSWFEQKARFFPFCPETTFGRLTFKMNNEYISRPVNLLIARRPVNS